MRYMTDKHVAELAQLAGVAEDEIVPALDDADRVYAYVRRNEGISDEDLRAYGERVDLPPDRMNAAIAVLRADERLFTSDAAEVVPIEEGRSAKP